MPVKTERKRTQKRPDERRRDLMDAAVRTFRHHAIANTTVADIAEAAGVAKGTFYLYFESKDALLGALKEQYVDELLDRASGLYDLVGQEDWWALVDATVQTMVDFMLENRDRIQVFAQEGLRPETARVFAECEMKLRLMFAAGIAAGMEDGVFEVTDPYHAAMLLGHAVHGSVEHAILYDENLDRDRLLSAATEMVRKTLAP